MTYIYYLKFTELAYRTLPPVKRLINEHYVFKFDTKFYVMTSKPVKGLKSTLIHTTNIEGQIGKKQYVIEHAHIYDIKYHIMNYSLKGAAYFAEHKEKFQPILDAIKELL